MKIERGFGIASIVVGVVLSMGIPDGQAANCTWNTTTGNWATPGDWNACGGLVPGTNDFASIGATGLVTVNAAQSAGAVGNAGAINIDAFTLTISGGANSGVSTNSGTITAGSLSTGSLLISNTAFGNTGGNIVVNGTGSFLNLSNATLTAGTLTTTNGGLIQANSSSGNFLSGVTLNGTLDLTSIINARERIINGATVNGAINIGNGGILSLDSASTAGGNQSIGGTGVINLNDSGARLAIDGNGSTTLGSNIVVRGQGNVGQAINTGGTNTLINNGRISADVNGGTLNLLPPGNGGSSSIVNNAVLDARSGGTLLLSTNIDNSAGQINAQNGSVVRQNGSTITGGTLGSSGTGAIQAVSSASNFLSGVTLTGVLDLTSVINSRERIINGATVNGVVNIGNGGILSLDSASTAGGNQSIGGTGVINLNDSGARLAVDGNGNTTLGSGITVRGQGNIGQAINTGGTNTLTNNGLISADVNGATLNIMAPANGGGSAFVNGGTLQAINGGTLLLSTNVTANTGSQIIAGAGSAVVQNGVTINGVINASGTGVFTAVSSANNFLNAVNFTGTLDLSTIVNSRERIINGATFNGSINIANGGILSLDSAATSGGNQSIAGSLTINLNDSGARLAIDGNGTTTLGSGVTVRGQGNIGQAINTGGTNTLTNNGLISADVNGGTLNITAPANGGGSSFVNGGTLQAINGGTLLLSTNVTANTGSQIIAGASSAVVQNGVTINGVINASGTGVFTAVSSASNFLSGVDFTGTLDIGSITNARERIINGATINGAVNIGNGGILSLDSASTAGGNQSIGGTGVINLNDSGARLAVDGNGSTTLGSNIVVRGQGNVGQAINTGGTNTLINNGRISADVNGGTLNLVPPGNGGGSSIVNNAVLDARSGGTLLLSTNIDNSAGQINAQNGSVVRQNGSTITGGTLGSSGTGAIQAVSSASNFLNGVTLTGVLDLTSIINSRERIINGATVNGAVNIGNGGILSLDSAVTAGGNQSIGGTGVINLNDSGARLAVDGNGNTTLGSGITVRGQGNIGQAINTGGTNTLTNNGLISADVNGGTLNITAPANGGGSAFVNGGTLQVTAGATMAVTAGIANFGSNTLTGGTYIVNGATGSTGTMRLSSLGNSVAGEIVNNAANIVLNGPSANTLLVDAGGNAALKPLANNSGSVTFSGGYAFTSVGNLANSGAVNIGSGSGLTVGPGAANSYNQSAGTTSVLGSLSAGSVNINGGTLLGTGTVSGNTTIATGGSLLPGASSAVPGTLGFTGSLVMNGTLNEGLAQSGFGVTSVIGSLTLSGSSVLNLLQDPQYNPVAGTTLVIMTSGSAVSGIFGSILNQTFNAGTQMWNILYNQGGFNVELVAANVGATQVTATWSTGSGNWTTGTQWSCAPGPATCVPNNNSSNAYNAILSSAGNTLTLDSTSSPTSVGVLSLAAQAGTLNVGQGSTLAVSGSVTNTATATLQLSGGTMVVGGSLGNSGAITGNGTIAGAGSLTNAGAVYADGGTLDLSSFSITNLSGGTLTGGTWQAGVSSAGTLKLPGNISTNSAGIFLQNAGSQFVDGSGANALASVTSNQGGSLTLFGGATFTSGGSFTNNNGSTLNSSFGGSALTISGNLANTSASLVNVNGNFGGATIAVLGNLSNDGTSTVQIQNGGVLNVNGSFTNAGTVVQTSGAVTVGNNLVIGASVGSSGTYNLSGGASVAVTGSGASVVVGGAGTGLMTMIEGSTLTLAADGSMIIGASATGNGRLEMTGGSSIQAGAFFGIGHNGTASTGGTATVVLDNSDITATNIALGSGGCLAGSGTLHGNFVMDGATTIGGCDTVLISPLDFGIEGILKPGRSPGILVFDGGFQYLSGSIELEILSDGLGGFVTDQIIFTHGTVLGLTNLIIEYVFLDDTDPNLFAQSNQWVLDTFFKTIDAGGQVEGISDLGIPLASLFANSQYSASSDAYVIEGFAFAPATGVDKETLDAIPISAAVPEPSTAWLLLLASLLLLRSGAIRRTAVRARRA